MKFYVFREHLVPTSIDGSSVVKNLYKKYFDEHNVIMTTFDMNRVLRKKWKRYETLELVTVAVEVPKAKYQLNAAASESMDQYWIEKKPSIDNFMVMGKLTFKRSVCCICMETHGLRIELYPCKCIFHKKCIQQWAKYSNTCPVCSCTIYKRKLVTKSKCREKENDITPLLEEVV